MKYTSTITRQFSKDPAVSFTVRHLTEGRRIKISLALADKYDKIDELQRGAAELAQRVKPLIDEAKAKAKADGKPEKDAVLADNVDLVALVRLNGRVRAVENDEIIPIYVKALLVSVDGLEIDGTPATPETAVESGPPELYAEISAAVKREMGLSEPESGNSEPPSISSAPVDGATPNSSAATAKDAETPA